MLASQVEKRVQKFLHMLLVGNHELKNEIRFENLEQMVHQMLLAEIHEQMELLLIHELKVLNYLLWNYVQKDKLLENDEKKVLSIQSVILESIH